MWISYSGCCSEKRNSSYSSMATSAVVLNHKQPSSAALLSSSLSHFSASRFTSSLQYKRKLKGAFRVTASSGKNIVLLGGTRFIDLFLSRLHAKQGHQVTKLFINGKAPIAQQLPVESDTNFTDFSSKSKDFAVQRRKVMALILSGFILSQGDIYNSAFAQTVGFREYVDKFDGYSFKYPQNWIPVRGAGADIFFRDPYVLDENISVDISSPSSSKYKSVEDLGSPEEAGKNVLQQYLTEFMSTRLGVKRESTLLSTSSKVASDGKLYYEVEVNIKSYANNNELAVMPEDRVVRMEWNRRYLSVLGVENNRLYELRLQTPEKSFVEEEGDIREVMDSFRVNEVAA